MEDVIELESPFIEEEVVAALHQYNGEKTPRGFFGSSRGLR